MKSIDDVKAEINKYVKLGNILRETGVIRTDMDEEQFSCPFHGKDTKPSARYYKSTDSCYCFTCFVPGTLVNTELGYRPIESIKEGERVLSLDGKYHRVKSVFKRQYTGEVVSIVTNINTNPIVVTKEHPFLVLRRTYKNKLPNKYIYNKSIKKGNTSIISSYSLDWDAAETITKKDWLVPQWNSDLRDLDKISIPKEFLKKSNKGPKTKGIHEFIVDNEFLWVVGMYIAEGSSAKRSIVFSLNRDEEEYQKRLLFFFRRYGYDPKLYYKGKKGATIYVCSTVLEKWFPAWLGHLCQNKHIPQELMYLPKDKAWSLVKGIYDGDSVKSTGLLEQTSEILTLQLSDILHRVGEQPLLHRHAHKSLTPKGNKRLVSYNISWEKNHRYKDRIGRWSYEDKILAFVRKTSKHHYTGVVYNLEVEEDPTYVVNGIVVHNCHKAWDLYSFLMQRDTATFKEVINTLIKHYKIDLSKLPEAIVSAGRKSFAGKKDAGVNEEKLFIIKAGTMISGMRGKVEVEKYRRIVFAYLLLKYATSDDIFREKALKLKEVLVRLYKEIPNG